MVSLDVTKDTEAGEADVMRVADMTPKQLGESIRWNVFMGILGANVILGTLGAILLAVLNSR